MRFEVGAPWQVLPPRPSLALTQPPLSSVCIAFLLSSSTCCSSFLERGLLAHLDTCFTAEEKGTIQVSTQTNYASSALMINKPGEGNWKFLM